jgi:hypothetical protein
MGVISVTVVTPASRFAGGGYVKPRGSALRLLFEIFEPALGGIEHLNRAAWILGFEFIIKSASTTLAPGVASSQIAWSPITVTM